MMLDLRMIAQFGSVPYVIADYARSRPHAIRDAAARAFAFLWLCARVALAVGVATLLELAHYLVS